MRDATVSMVMKGYIQLPPYPRYFTAIGKEEGIQGVSHADIVYDETDHDYNGDIPT